MVQRLPEGYQIDPADPRAPSQEVWDRMSPEERARVVAMLPSEDKPAHLAPEGDVHRKAKNTTAETLDAFFRRIGRKIYVSSEIGVYYPGEPRFSPDVLAVLDVETHDRSSWVVSTEGKGLDLAIEIHVSGDVAKDHEANVERYARLGIQEYFIFDRLRSSLKAYRLPPPVAGRRRPQAYLPILPQQGRYASEVLGLDLTLEGTRLRFLLGMAPIPEHEELIAKLGAMLDDALVKKQAVEETAASLQQELAEARAEIERLKRGG
jgi:Uma2 family endonuclease